jgi:hypothetical protein
MTFETRYPEDRRHGLGIQDAGYTGVYDEGKVWTGDERNGVAALFTELHLARSKEESRRQDVINEREDGRYLVQIPCA